MSRTQHLIVTVLALLCLATVAANIGLSLANRAAQAEVNQRQQFVQQSVQLEGLYREIVRALAELAARNSDNDVRALLQRHGVSYSVNAPGPAPVGSSVTSSTTSPAANLPPARK